MMILHQREEDISYLKKEHDSILQKLNERPSHLNSFQTDISTKENLPKSTNKSLHERNFVSYENPNDAEDTYKNYPRRNTAKSNSQNRSPLHENYTILNQPEDYAHTEDSFGEYNNHYNQNELSKIENLFNKQMNQIHISETRIRKIQNLLIHPE